MNDLTVRIASLEARVAKIENFLISKPKAAVASSSPESYEGPRGGIRMLVGQGFFNEKRLLGAVRAALTENGYHYSRQSAHEALTALSKPGGPLVSLKEGVGKAYVNRK